MKNLFRIIFCIFVLIQLSACVSDSDSLSETNDVDNALELDFTIPVFDLEPNGLSKTYDEYYSGYWRSSYLCGGSGRAILGISGNEVELNTGANYMESVFGEIDPDGHLNLNTRTPSWSCETCGVVPPLETTGDIDFEENRGTLDVDAACPNNSRTGHTIVTVKIDLKSGASQPHPQSEMYRIKNEAYNLIGESVQSCQDYSECRTFNIDTQEDFCNFQAKAYSIQIVDEEKLNSLKNEYAYQKWLITSPGTSTTLCGIYYRDSCVSNVCIME